MADELAAFLRARLDEDEAYLNSNRRHLWTERPLREVQAKRAIVARYEKMEWPLSADWYTALKYALRQLAAVYGDHPDYRAEWKP